LVENQAIRTFGPRQRPPINGGGDPVSDEVAARARLQTLIEGGELPRSRPRQLWSGPCPKRHDCTICGTSIEVGDVELEITLPADVVIFVHRRCFNLWTEVSGDGDQGRPRS
jgi:hypothetical protein